MTDQSTKRRKGWQKAGPGRKPGPPLQSVHIELTPEQADWTKRQEKGRNETIRRLVQQAMDEPPQE